MVPLATPAQPPPSDAAWTVSVKALCAFGAKAGDLDFRFVPVPSALEGMAGHSLVQSRRGAGYAREVSLATRHGPLAVRGRADGYDAAQGRVEEIKTFRGRFDAIRANHRALHWAQARCYGWMLCERDGLDALDVALVYLDLATGEETLLQEHCTREDLRARFEALCTRFMDWARRRDERRHALARELAALDFPHAQFRPGQRALAQGVYRAAAAGRCLLAQAPTGIGKSIATTFPLLKGWPAHRTDRLFFLTAKTPGRAIALEALQALTRSGGAASLRVLELTARDKACEHPGQRCDGESCPLARGFYDRLPPARDEAMDLPRLDRATLREVAARHAVCPYYLSQEMARWSDVVVADYNHWFDASAFLFALAREEDWRVAVLVDEAHNLLERARGMYSATLAAPDYDEATRRAPSVVRPALAALRREWRALRAPDAADYTALDAVPERLLPALQNAVGALSEHFGATPQDAHGPLQRFFFDLVHFTRLADAFGAHSVFELDLADAQDALRIRNLVPAPFLRGRFAATLSSVCFSGTIAPFGFYRDMLGLPGDTLELDVASPFGAHQLRVRVATHLSTRLRDRAASQQGVVALMARQYAQRPGNYLAYFSSFEHLEAVHAAFCRHAPQVATWAQARRMAEPERDAFVARFAPGGQGIGFAVLGGAFGEGIDLPGDRLIGAFVASLGLPQHDAANEVARERIERQFGQGYDYTYLYPGLRKVVQAAGRVIRSEGDEGVLWLLDDRFARPEVLALLPAWWRVEFEGEGINAPSAGDLVVLA